MIFFQLNQWFFPEKHILYRKYHCVRQIQKYKNIRIQEYKKFFRMNKVINFVSINNFPIPWRLRLDIFQKQRETYKISSIVGKSTLQVLLRIQWNLSVADMLYSGHLSISDTICKNQIDIFHWNWPLYSGHLFTADTFLENQLCPL